MGAGLVFWGWQTGFLPVGFALALALEARALVTSRWDLARADFNRVSDLSTVLLVLVGVYQVITTDVARAVTGIIQWLPLVVFPLVAAQRYSVAGRVETATFFWSQRSRPGLTAQIDLRTYGVGAQILRHLGVRRMKLLGNPRRMPSMTGYGLEVTGFVTAPNPH